MSTTRPVRARLPKPGKSLAEMYPEVAATWNHARNDGLKPTFIGCGNTRAVWWICTDGHEWSESVASRVTDSVWKQGNRAACRECSGVRATVTYQCGHSAQLRLAYHSPDHARAQASKTRCPACWGDTQRENSGTAKKFVAEYRDEAGKLVDELPAANRVPAPLASAARGKAVSEIAYALVSERHFGREGELKRAVQRVSSRLGALTPSPSELRRATERREPVRVGERAHWPAGWMTWLSPHRPRHRVQDDTTVAAVKAAAESAFQYISQLKLGDALPVAQRTKILTDSLAGWAQQRRWTPYRELGVPVVTSNSQGQFGRVDLTVFRPRDPDIVIEIDSGHNDASVEKLEFARDAGALAIWLRWSSGVVHNIPGVAVIDLVEFSRSLRQAEQ